MVETSESSSQNSIHTRQNSDGPRVSLQNQLPPLNSAAGLGVRAEGHVYDFTPRNSSYPATDPSNNQTQRNRASAANPKTADDTFINWLSAMRLSEYYQNFAENHITFDMLADLKKEDLKELVPRVGDRIRIWKAISGLLATSSTSANLTQYSLPPQPPSSTVSTSRTSKGNGEHRSNSARPAPDPRFSTVTFHTHEKKSLHVELLPTTQILSYVRHCAKLPPDTTIKVNDSFDVYSDDASLRRAIFDHNIREFWIESAALGTTSTNTKTNTNTSNGNNGGLSTSASSSSLNADNAGNSSGSMTPKAIPARSYSISSRRESKLLAPDLDEPTLKPSPLPTPPPPPPPHLPPSSSSAFRQGNKPLVFLQERPSQIEVTRRISEYFPGTDQQQLAEGLRNSNIINNRFSGINGSWRSSFRYSKRFSTVSNLQPRGDRPISTAINENDNDYELLERLDSEEMAPSKWIRGKLVGSGSFGTVYMGFNLFTGDILAVKQVQINENGERQKRMVDALRREISLLRELDHENIVQYRGFKREGNKLNIFLEYVAGGSLASKLIANGPMDERDSKLYIRQCLLGLEYLHERGIIHRDIKGANILVDAHSNVKISDFGLSKHEQPGKQRFSMQGTAFWMAPEVARAKENTTTKADIWSLGCLMIEMLTGEHPFPKLQAFQAIYKIGSGASPEVPSNISSEMENMLKLCLKHDPKQRANARELLQNPFMAK